MFKIEYFRTTPVLAKQSVNNIRRYEEMLRLFKLREPTHEGRLARESIMRLLRGERQLIKNTTTMRKISTERRGVVFSDTSDNRQVALAKIREQIRDFRANERKLQCHTGYYSVYREGQSFGMSPQMCRGVHKNPGDFLNFYKAIKNSKIFKHKKPVSEDKHIAYELEFFTECSQTTLAAHFSDANLTDYVTLKGDGSIRPSEGSTGFEIAVCMPRSELLEITERVCKVLTAVEAKVNKTCGFHVHLDMRNKTEPERDRIFSNLVSAQKILYQMMPPSRKLGTGSSSRSGGYSKPNRSKDYYSNLHDRYVGINALAYSKFRTLEVRLHSGTTDYVKIISFILILEAIVNKQDEIKRATSTVSGFVKQFSIPSELASYIQARVDKFASAHSSRDTVTEDVA